MSSNKVNLNSTQPAAILFLTFNRPDLFQRTLEAARLGGGAREIFISIDGPRTTHPEDTTRCEEVYEIARKIDWATQLHLKVEQNNLGCGAAVTSAIQWALDKVPEIIVLEDDCLPDPSFFVFCDELLERYRNDERVMQISGTNWGAAVERYAGNSYAFNSFAPIWGWATWRRAWQYNELRMESWPRVNASGMLEGMALSSRFRRIMRYEWERTYAGLDAWDFAWQYTVMRQNGFSISPSRNLVVNIGFCSGATHVNGIDRVFSFLPLERIDFPLRHPPEVIRNTSVESVFESIYWHKVGWPIRAYRHLVRNERVRAMLRTLARKLFSRPT